MSKKGKRSRAHEFRMKLTALTFGLLMSGAFGNIASASVEAFSNLFGINIWNEEDLAKSGQKGYFGGRFHLPQGSSDWPEHEKERWKQYQVSLFAARETLHEQEVPKDLMTFSEDSWNPNLAPESVRVQAKRVARERNISEEALIKLINSSLVKPFFGDPWIDIQSLNRKLDLEHPIIEKTNAKTKTAATARKQPVPTRKGTQVSSGSQKSARQSQSKTASTKSKSSGQSPA